MTTRATSIAQALTAEQARMIAGRFLSAVERCEEHGSIDTLIRDLRRATDDAERAAGCSDEWHRLARLAQRLGVAA